MPGLVAMGHSNCTFVVGILVALLTFFLTKRQISRIWGTVRNLNVLNPHRALLVGYELLTKMIVLFLALCVSASQSPSPLLKPTAQIAHRDGNNPAFECDF